MYLGSPPGVAPPGRRALSDDAFVVLDPMVELLDVAIAGYRFLAHGHFETGMTIPPGDGLLDVVAELAGAPVRVGTLREGYSDAALIDRMLTSLIGAGFAHVSGHAMPSGDAFAVLRDGAMERRRPAPRPHLTVDLDIATIENLRLALDSAGAAPDITLRCARLAECKAVLDTLADARMAGRPRLFRVEIRTADATCDAGICAALRRLEAAVVIENVTWPAPDRPVPGVAELTSRCIAVHAAMTPGRSILDPDARERATRWATSTFVSGLRLDLAADALWPLADVADADFDHVFDALDALEDGVGDVLVESLPNDEVILGRAATSRPATISDRSRRFRLAYLHRRIPFLKACEGDNAWSQTPEAEDKLVRAADDLLPNHPDLLGLEPGGVLVDVCGGLGRVARRLSPAVGADGMVVSIEMLRCLSDRARQFACDRGFANLHFRPGLAQRLPLPDGAADAAVNEWTGAIWELGIGPAMVREMARVVRPGGRIAVTHRLVRLPLAKLGEPWIQYAEIYGWVRDAFRHPALTIVAERVWGQIAPSLIGENANLWRKQYLPCVIDPFDFLYDSEAHEGAHADIYLTIIAQVASPRERPDSAMSSSG